MAKKEPQSRWSSFLQALTNWWNPLAWVTFIIVLAVYLVDMKHVYEFFIFQMTSHYAQQPATFFGFEVGVTNAVFDASAFSVIITALTWLLSQYIPKRLANAEPAKLWLSAFIGGLVLSGLANANAFIEDVRDEQLHVLGDNYITWILIGFFVTFLLAFFVGIDAWDKRRKVLQERADQDEAHRLEFMNSPQYKNAPDKYKPGILAKKGLTIPTGDTQSPVRIGKQARRIVNSVRNW